MSDWFNYSTEDLARLEQAGISAANENAQEVFKDGIGQHFLDCYDSLWWDSAGSKDAICQSGFSAFCRQIVYFSEGVSRIQSPIEQMLFAALLWQVPLGALPRVRPKPERFDTTCWGITPQWSFGRYRLDFLLWMFDSQRFAQIAVECDGHNFHEKTKEQARKDKARDRSLLMGGVAVARFTGSEIFADATSCAVEATELLRKTLLSASASNAA